MMLQMEYQSILYLMEKKIKEIYATTDYIKRNINLFKNNIVVCDRAYYSYDFLDFLNKNKIKFIVRAKGSADLLNQTTELKQYNPKYNAILNIKKYVRVIKYENVI